MNRNLYGIMLKYPEPGKVKTRLAKYLGDEKAAEIYRVMAERILKNTETTDHEYVRIVFCDPAERLENFVSWLPDEQLILQQGNDVGERMDNAIRDILAMGAAKAVLTGADIPALNSAIISGAFAALDHADIVIGPAADGGYYLIGMKEPHGEIFRGIPWSTATVLNETVRAIRRLKLGHAYAATLSDLDTPEDYNRFLMQAALPKPETSS
jgi:uncharacterized protein